MKHILRINSYLYYLIPFVLLTGPFLPDLFLTFIAISSTLIILKKKEFDYFKNYFFIIFIIFYLFLIISSLSSDFIVFSLSTSIVYLRFGLFVIATIYLINSNNNFIKNFTNILIVTYLFVLASGYFQFFFGFNLIGIESTSSRLNLPLSDNQIIGGYLARVFPLLLGLIFYTYKLHFKQYVFILLLFIFTDILVYLSGERTALALICIASLAIIIFLKNFKTLRILSFLISILCIIIITITNPSIKERNLDKTIDQLGVNDSRINIFSIHHESIFKGAYKIFLDNKLIGSGPNNFRNLCNKEEYNINQITCSTHPHNTYIQILAELGLIGLFIFLLAIAPIIFSTIMHFIYIIKNERKLTDCQVCLMVSILLIIWPVLPTLNFFNNWINILYFLPIGFYLHTVYTIDQENY